MKTSGKIRVLEVIRQGKVGGGETHLISLLENLNRSLFDPIVLSFTDGPMISRLNELGIQSYVIPTEQAFNFSIWAKVKHILKEKNIALVHIHGTRAYTNVLWPAKQLGIPIVYTVHGWSFHDGQDLITKFTRVLSERVLVYQAHRTISVSQSDQLTGKKHFGKFDSVVINNGVDLKKFSVTRQMKDIRVEYAIPKDVMLIGYISRITHQKNPIGMVEAFHQVLSHTKDMRLLMVGEGELKEQVLARTKKLKIEEYVYFDNFRLDMPDILKAIDVYCLPSLWEGLPIGLLEAMAMGKAVIATNVNGSREVVKHKENGLLIEPKNISALVDAILQLHRQQDLKKKLQTQARNTIDEKYDVARMTQDTEEVYHQVMINPKNLDEQRATI